MNYAHGFMALAVFGTLFIFIELGVYLYKQNRLIGHAFLAAVFLVTVFVVGAAL